MPRPNCIKTIQKLTAFNVFKPNGIPLSELETIVLTHDEIEAMRLSDYEGLYQDAASRAMGISRQTFGRIIQSARKKTVTALLNGKALSITGGNVRLKEEEEIHMKIAIPTKGDQIDQHFGHCEKYAIFTVEGSVITAEETVASVAGCGCKSNIASTLAAGGVTVLLSGGIGDGAINVLARNGIKTIRGASGNARNAVEQFLKGELTDSGENCHAHENSNNGDHVCQH